MEQSFSASPQSVPKSLSQKLRNPLYKVWRSFLPWLVPMFAIVLWQLLSQAGVISSKILPAPLDVLKVGIKLAQSGELLK
ncbi:MAG: aliphatic sulfonate ABC transporter permease SsuC, partial [Pseudanabaena sp.]